MATIYNRIESERGCGYRKKGGMYLCSDGIAQTCCLLPQELTVCPCCGEGIKPARGWTWVTGALFTKQPTCYPYNTERDGNIIPQSDCPLTMVRFFPDTRMGLMWVGEKFYNTSIQFTREAQALGVSKRIAQIPHDLVVGETWVLLAHRKAVVKYVDGEPQWSPGIFQVFKPSRIEYVITGEESEEQLNAIEKRGITLVNVIRDVDAQTSLQLSEDAEKN